MDMYRYRFIYDVLRSNTLRINLAFKNHDIPKDVKDDMMHKSRCFNVFMRENMRHLCQKSRWGNDDIEDVAAKMEAKVEALIVNIENPTSRD